MKVKTNSHEKKMFFFGGTIHYPFPAFPFFTLSCLQDKAAQLDTERKWSVKQQLMLKKLILP
jgi:hypothetical protein